MICVQHTHGLYKSRSSQDVLRTGCIVDHRLSSRRISNLWHVYVGIWKLSLQGRHNERHGISNHRPLDCLLSCLFRRRSKKISKFRVSGLCEGNLPVTGEFPSQRASGAENASIWWRHHVLGETVPQMLLLLSELYIFICACTGVQNCLFLQVHGSISRYIVVDMVF